ncbi:MAG TPA: alpha/beta hydrolase [candidate division Zixibacteria bacterium]|nr:alpha/beta hydrolase [candidate division Zixibacteria bacterium]
MPKATLDGLEVYYEIYGSGPPLLMLAPGGFDATIEKWRTASAWTGLDALQTLSAGHRLIVYDRRESGRSGGRVERIGWSSYSRQAKALLDHLGIDAAHVMGGCMGCSVALSFAVDYPSATRSLVLHWPVGGYRWKAAGLERFARHYRFTAERGLAAVVERARTGKSFWADPEAGPWASVIDQDEEFARGFSALDPERYLGIVTTSGRALFDRDTATGAEPEQLLGVKAPALIVPGDDASHATSAAHYLRECLPNATFWNIALQEQTTRKICDRVLEFCRTH